MTGVIATKAEAEVEGEEEENGEEDGEEELEEEEEEETKQPSNGAFDTMKANSSERNAPSKEMRTKNKQSSPATGASPKKRRKVNHGEKYPYPGGFGEGREQLNSLSYYALIANRFFFSYEQRVSIVGVR